MPELTFKEKSFPIEKYESVLDCLLRNAQHIPYACKAGMCQACLVKAVEGTPPEEARKWIKSSLQEKGYCLACQWVPDESVTVALPSIEEFSVEVQISELKQLTDRIMRIRLQPADQKSMFAYSPGQYLTLINPAGISRCYSIANSYDIDGFIELHISQTLKGVFTHWLFSEAKTTDTMHIRGPAGDCFYTSDEQDESSPMLMAGTGTGLAPLYGILHDALRRGHSGAISLYQGARDVDSLYYTAELAKLAGEHSNFNYFPVCQHAPENSATTFVQGDLQDVIIASLAGNDLVKTHVYLCGNPDFVHGMRKQIFLKGARSGNIFCDPFLERKVPS